MKNKVKIGLALGSGSARGLAHVGVLKVLEEAGIKIDFIAGASIGAMIGVAYALYGKVSPLLDAVYEIQKKPVNFMIDPAFPIKGIVSGKKIEAYLDDFGFKNKEFRDLKIPAIVVATDVFGWRRVALIQGSITKAVRASISVPGIFSPVKYGNTYLVDGGVTDPVPVDLLYESGVDFVIAVGLFPSSDVYTVWNLRDDDNLPKVEDVKENKAFYELLIQIGKDKMISSINWLKNGVEGPNVLSVLFTSINIMQKELSIRSLKMADIAIVPPDLRGGLLDFDKAPEFIEKGEKAARKMLPLIEKKLKEKEKSALLVT